MYGRTSRSVLFSAALVALFSTVAVGAFARESEDPQSGVPNSILHFETVTVADSGDSAAQSGAMQTRSRGKRLAVSFHTLGRNFDLDLEPNDLFVPGAKNVWIDDAGQVEEEPARIFYRGRLRGSDGSWVRVAVSRGVIDGMIWTPDEVYFVEPSSRFFADAPADEMIAYRLSDTESDWTDESCAAKEPAHRLRSRRPHGGGDGRSLYDALAGALQQIEGATTLKELDLGVVADYQLYQRRSTNSATFMQNIVNLIDGVYEREISLKLRISHSIVYATENDPFADVTDPSTALSHFGTFKSNNSSAGGLLFGADLAHLFTGRDLNNTVVGMAWVGTVCNTMTGSGISQDYTSTTNSLVGLVAHEIGHNLSASHDGSVGCGGGFIMNASVVTVTDLQNLHFSSCSKTAIGNHIPTRACLADYQPGTPTPTPTATPTRTSTPSPIPTNNAVFVSQSVPTVMDVGQQYVVSVRFRNTGGIAWGGQHFLGSQNPYDNFTWGMHRVALGTTVAPGQERLVTWTVTAPSTPGNYNFQWRMLEEGVVWFGGASPNVVVNVRAPTGPNNATFVSQNVPTVMEPGQLYQVSVRFRNAGGTTWNGNYRLGSQNPQDNWTWGMNRVVLGATVLPGLEHTVTWTVRAPSTPGNYIFQWRPLQLGVAWFGQQSPHVVVNVQGAANSAAFVEQEVPAEMQAGEEYEVTVRMRNTGDTTWDAGYRLGAQNPRDSMIWGLNRVTFPSATEPGAEGEVVFTLTAPSTPGNYNFQWKMVELGVEWFGEMSENVHISVQ